MTIKEVYVNLLDEMGVSKDVIEEKQEEGMDIIQMPITVSDTVEDVFITTAICVEEESLFMFHATYPGTVPEEKREKAALDIARINFAMKLGSVQLDMESGILLLRDAQHMVIDDEETLQDMVQIMVQMDLMEFQDLYPVLKEFVEY